MCLIQYLAIFYLITFLYLLSVKHFYASLSSGQVYDDYEKSIQHTIFFIKYSMSIIQYLAIFVLIIFLYLLSVKYFYALLFFYAWLHKICSSHNLFCNIWNVYYPILGNFCWNNIFISCRCETLLCLAFPSCLTNMLCTYERVFSFLLNIQFSFKMQSNVYIAQRINQTFRARR